MRSFILFAGLVLAWPAGAQSLRLALDQAWQRSPQAQTLEAQQREAEARLTAAGSLTPAPPTLGVSYRGDQLNRDLGQREVEAEVGLPLWLPGERSARQEAAEAGIRLARSQVLAQRLALAGELREAAWALRLARIELALQEERRRAAQVLEADVAKRVKVGELARTDELLTRNETLTARAALLDQQTKLIQAEQAWRLLTGSLPAVEEAVESPGPGQPLDDHPQLQAAQAAVALAQAKSRLTAQSRRDSPELALFTRRERRDGAEPYSNSIGVRFTLPLATDARNKPRDAAAETARVQSEADYQMLRRKTELAAEQAQQALDVAQAQLKAAATRRDITAENLRLNQKAFNLGEFSLTQLLRAQSAAFEAELFHHQQQARLGLARSRLHQARGILP